MADELPFSDHPEATLSLDSFRGFVSGAKMFQSIESWRSICVTFWILQDPSNSTPKV